MKEIDKKMKDLRFNITEDMNNTMIELLLTNQMLEESLKKDSKMTDEERGLLYNHYEKLKDNFTSEFKKNNKEQIKIYNSLMNR